jgi:putative aldouronate transport system permease protein
MAENVVRKKEKLGARMTTGDKVFVVVVYTILSLLMLTTLYPMIFIISASFSDPQMVSTGQMLLWPVGVRMDGYKYILQYSEIWTGYLNTLLYAVVGTLLNLAVTLPCAYALSRKDMKGRGLIMGIFMVTMYINGGMIPGYLNVKSFGLLDTRFFIIINGAISVYNLIVARTFFTTTIPGELQEAARIDGCNDFQIFFKIVLPLSSAITVVLALYYGVGRWNSYFTEMIYLKDRSKFPLQLFLREILVQSQFAQQAMQSGQTYSAEQMMALIKQAETANMIKYCVIIIATAPMLIIYPFLQKYFEKGVMIGAVKG